MCSSAIGHAAGAWEQFTVDDLAGGGSLISSNVVNLQAYNGLYLSATNGGGSSVLARQRAPASAESFSLIKLSGAGTLTNGNPVAIRTSGGKYVTVKPDGSVDASGTSIGTAQTFTLQMALSFLPLTPGHFRPHRPGRHRDQQPDQPVLEGHARSHELQPQARFHQWRALRHHRRECDRHHQLHRCVACLPGRLITMSSRR